MLFLSCLCYAFRARMFDAFWSPAGKGLTSWLSFVISNYEVAAFPLVSWVRCGTWLYRFLIFALFLTLNLLVCYMKRRLSNDLITLYFCSKLWKINNSIVEFKYTWVSIADFVKSISISTIAWQLITIYFRFSMTFVSPYPCFISLFISWFVCSRRWCIDNLGVFHANQNIYVYWSTSELRVRLAPWSRFKPSSKIFYLPFQVGTSFVDHLCCFCLESDMPLCASVDMYLVFTCLERADHLVLVCGGLLWVCHFPIGILGHVWYLIVSIPDLYTHTYFKSF